MKFIALIVALAASSAALAETAVERECASGKCTCTDIASTCKTWNRTHGGDLAICDSYRQTCLSTGGSARTACNVARNQVFAAAGVCGIAFAAT